MDTVILLVRNLWVILFISVAIVGLKADNNSTSQGNATSSSSPVAEIPSAGNGQVRNDTTPSYTNKVLINNKNKDQGSGGSGGGGGGGGYSWGWGGGGGGRGGGGADWWKWGCGQGKGGGNHNHHHHHHRDHDHVYGGRGGLMRLTMRWGSLHSACAKGVAKA